MGVGTPDVDSSCFPMLKLQNPSGPPPEVPAMKKPTTFLCMGIVCPRKNQAFTVKCFKEFAQNRQDVRLLVVGVRRVREYEIAYVNEVEKMVDGDTRIELHDVTHEVDAY